MEAVSRAGQRPGRFHGSAGCREESVLILRDTGPRGGLAGVRPLKLPFSGHCVRWILEITCSTAGLGEVMPKNLWVSDHRNLKTSSPEGSFYIHVTLAKPPRLRQEWA